MLIVDGIILNFFMPYHWEGCIVLDQTTTTQAFRVYFHPWAWLIGIAVNAGGVAAHIAQLMWAMLPSVLL